MLDALGHLSGKLAEAAFQLACQYSPNAPRLTTRLTTRLNRRLLPGVNRA